MSTNEKVNSELRDYIDKGYEILMNNIDEKAKETMNLILKLSVDSNEGSTFEFKRNVLIEVLEKVKEEE
ncbi:hypothetical protein FHK07_12010 [Listeria monocytogenes]|nr:hypothetical protein [Listeria monocytogenes]EJM6842199.1 hypothetical protein [Listeria monocytogenes]